MAIVISTDAVTYLSWRNQWHEVWELGLWERREVLIVLPSWDVLVVNRADAVTFTEGDYGLSHGDLSDSVLGVPRSYSR